MAGKGRRAGGAAGHRGDDRPRRVDLCRCSSHFPAFSVGLYSVSPDDT